VTNIGDLLLIALACALTFMVPVDIWIRRTTGPLSVRGRVSAGIVLGLAVLMLLVNLWFRQWVFAVVYAVVVAIWWPLPWRR
jgi:hypothetical protein